MEYSRLYGSTFPEGLPSLIPEGMKSDVNVDVDSEVYNSIKLYYEYLDSGNLTEAANLYKNSGLESYSITSSDYNRWQEELYNLGVAILNNSSTIHGDEEPASQSTYGHWLVEY